MEGKKTKKWIPLALVVLFAAGAAAALLFLPDEVQGPSASLRGSATLRATGSSAQNQPPPVTISKLDPDADLDLPDVGTGGVGALIMDEDDEEVLQQRPPTLDEEDKQYPAPFAKPDGDDR